MAARHEACLAMPIRMAVSLSLASSLSDAGGEYRTVAGNMVPAGSYLIFYTIGYADGRPTVPVTADRYADAEMTAVGAGVAQKIGSVLGAPVPPPRCPGTPGC